MVSKSRLHFTLGPVQGFVAQARRTRDLWAGSYLLSYLAGRAMLAAKAEISFPSVADDPLMKALEGEKPGKNDQAAQVGSLPNRFVVEAEDATAGARAVEAVRDAWQGIAQAVWKEYVKGVASEATEDIWQRQHRSFWDCSWVLGDDDRLLDQRKNLRVHFPPDEPGEKCTVCGERQEISGLGLGSAGSRRDMRNWWSAFRKSAGLSTLELRENERLCAICLTKRLFPKVSRKAIGWEVPTGFPSVAYMAAVDWIKSVLDQAENASVAGAVQAFVEACNRARVGSSEKETRIRGISERLAGKSDVWGKFVDLDGAVFHEDAIRNSSYGADDKNKLVSALKDIQKATGRVASPFYAMLLMDGDSMGRLLGGRSNEEKKKISAALGAFSRRVPEIVRQHDGRLIYCGGDDVFALLPLARAVDCARACREAYLDAFRKQASFVGPEGTISGAIVYAHFHVPLTTVVRGSHRLLDEVAKEKTGRDALACQVFKPGGIHLTWAMPWKTLLIQDEDQQAAITLLEKVLGRFGDRADAEYGFSSKFFYKIRDLFEQLSDEEGELILKREQAEAVLAANFLANREATWPRDWSEARKLKEARALVRDLLDLCSERERDSGDGGKSEIRETGRVKADGALLVRFLAQKGME